MIHHWQQSAACAEFPLDRVDAVFFSTAQEGIAEAKTICARCPVRRDCLHHAMTYPERWGVWGGLSEDERFGEESQVIVCRTCAMPFAPTVGNRKSCSPTCRRKTA